jgi:lipoic acid synthetase
MDHPPLAGAAHPLRDPSLKPPGAPRDRLAPWLKKRLPPGGVVEEVRALVAGLSLHTVCQSARCPNLNECWSRKAATFMILGEVCTRTCRFCTVPKGRPEALDPAEPDRVAEAAARLGLRHVVPTSTTTTWRPCHASTRACGPERATRGASASSPA